MTRARISLDRLTQYVKRTRIALSFARAAATAAARDLDPTDPTSWEFSAFSESGEDGIIDYLTRQLKRRDDTFLEIGAGDGLGNNTAWLALGRNFSGVMIEGHDRATAAGERLMASEGRSGVLCKSLFVTRESAEAIMELVTSPEPDVYSVDIDGNDFHLTKALFERGLRPKIAVVEYNSAFGRERSCTIPYDPTFVMRQLDPLHLYYGVSIAGWRTFFEAQGYRFVSVVQTGVNAFFADPRHFDEEFLGNIRGQEFRENYAQLRRFGVTWERQSELIRDRPLVAIEADAA